MNNHGLPKIRDSISYIYIEHAVIEKRHNAIEIVRAAKDDNIVERIPIPIASTLCVLLGPGTSISHAAVVAMADVGCSCIWCGENMSRFYSFGIGETNSSSNLLQQARFCMDEILHLSVVKDMYKLRFPDFAFSAHMSLKQMRGMEGVRMKSVYEVNAERTGVEWNGRNYTPGNLNDSDVVNRALSVANAVLYGVCHAAIVSMGLSPGLGFIHTGRALSFVYDVADLYKADTSIPAAFDVAREYSLYGGNVLSMSRSECRRYFVEQDLVKRIPRDLSDLLRLNVKGTDDEGNYIWQADGKATPGGMNHAGDAEGDDEVW